MSQRSKTVDFYSGGSEELEQGCWEIAGGKVFSLPGLMKALQAEAQAQALALGLLGAGPACRTAEGCVEVAL